MMLSTGIIGFAVEIIISLVKGADVYTWEVLALWAVVAICGAIKGARK